MSIKLPKVTPPAPAPAPEDAPGPVSAADPRPEPRPLAADELPPILDEAAKALPAVDAPAPAPEPEPEPAPSQPSPAPAPTSANSGEPKKGTSVAPHAIVAGVLAVVGVGLAVLFGRQAAAPDAQPTQGAPHGHPAPANPWIE